MSDYRTVHARYGSDEIVRYARAGKWYVEPADGKRWAVTLDQAVKLASEWPKGSELPGRPGGSQFDRRLRIKRTVKS